MTVINCGCLLHFWGCYEGDTINETNPDLCTVLTHSSPSVSLFFFLFFFPKAHRSFLRLQVTHTPTHLRVGLRYSLDCTIVRASQNRQECKWTLLISKPHTNPLLRSDSRDSLVRDARQVKQPSWGSHFWRVMVFVWQIDHILYTCKAETAEG